MLEYAIRKIKENQMGRPSFWSLLAAYGDKLLVKTLIP
jgi:hypothetical protein